MSDPSSDTVSIRPLLAGQRAASSENTWAEEARTARIVRVLGIGIFLAICPAIAHNLWRGSAASALGLLAEQGVLAWSLWLNRRGATHLAARVMSLASVALVILLQSTGAKGAHDVAALIYPLLLVIAGVSLDRRWFFIVTVVTMLAVAGRHAMELLGWVTYEMTRYLGWRHLLDTELILAVTALAMELLMRSLRESMNRLRAALHSLRESEDRYRTLFESVNEAILLHDPRDGRILDVNRRACEWFGRSREEMCSQSVADISSLAPGFQQADALRYVRAAASGQIQTFEWQCRTRDGRIFWCEVSMRAALIAGHPCVLVSARDIEERKRAAAQNQVLEGQLRQAQKMESIGRLAGGVAHDFNNLLTCISGNVEVAAGELGNRAAIAESLQEIRVAVNRAAELTRRLLTFSRKQPIEPRPLHLKTLFDSLYPMLARLLGENIGLECQVAASTHRIRADPGQLEQIVMNLAVNAKDAMPNGGSLRFEVDNSQGGEPSTSDGPFVRLRVRDSGLGIPADILPKIFEPFFTTKPVGKGTGLGLSMVLGAVEQNGGFIRVDSEVGRGTTFELFFPALLEASEGREDVPRSQGAKNGHETVLLVEDEASVGRMGARALQQLGYQVSVCADAAEAMKMVDREARRFDILVTDVILPGTDGVELSRTLTQKLPNLKVLYCSGYTSDVIANRGILGEGSALLPKPYTGEQLARKIRTILDAGSTVAETGGSPTPARAAAPLEQTPRGNQDSSGQRLPTVK